MNVIGKYNKAMGKTTVRFATQSLDRQWKMKQEKLSPRYTIRIDEIVSIKL